MPEDTYVGPTDLYAALDAAEEIQLGSKFGNLTLRMAVSSPNGDLLAVRVTRKGKQSFLIRHVDRMSGRAGSVAGTGRWVDLEVAEVFSWRPA